MNLHVGACLKIHPKPSDHGHPLPRPQQADHRFDPGPWGEEPGHWCPSLVGTVDHGATLPYFALGQEKLHGSSCGAFATSR
jgi:hypothetical protein